MDKQSLETCPAPGGERMRLDGHNFQHDSKVVFVEKAQGKKGGVLEAEVCVCVCVSVHVCVCVCLPRRCWRNPRTASLPPSSPPAVKISSILPECHMWCTLMRCIFNPADLHLQKFPLPVQQRNGSQMQHVLCVCVCVCVCARHASVFVSLYLT